jgi:hypothetical protein
LWVPSARKPRYDCLNGESPTKEKLIIIAVNSYVFRIPENWGGFVGTSDLTGNWDFSWGEFEADALVDDSLVDQVLGLELVDPPSPPFGLAKTGVNGGTLDKPGQ